jgi:hypothetical protein
MSVVNLNRLMLYREIIVVCCVDPETHISILYGKMRFFKVTASLMFR